MTTAESMVRALYAAGEHNQLYLSYRLNVPLHRVKFVTRDLRRTLPASFNVAYTDGIAAMGKAGERRARR